MAEERVKLGVSRLEGWITLTVAGERLGLSRWMVHKMSDVTGLADDEEPVLKTVRFVGVASRPVYIVREAEVDALRRDRAKMAELKAREESEKKDHPGEKAPRGRVTAA
jgi:hypothetical protein